MTITTNDTTVVTVPTAYSAGEVTLVVIAQISSGSVFLLPAVSSGAGELVVGQREAEQRDADDAGQQDRQHDLAQLAASGGAEIGRRLLVGAVEAAQHREHDQEPERQRPGELGAERRR